VKLSVVHSATVEIFLSGGIHIDVEFFHGTPPIFGRGLEYPLPSPGVD